MAEMGTLRRLSEGEEEAAEVSPGRCLEDVVQGFPDGRFRCFLLLKVHEEVAFDENLVVDAIDVVIGVMMTDQERDALDDTLGKAEGGEHRLGKRWALLLLQMAGVRAILLKADLDADVVDDGGRFYDQLRLFIHFFEQADLAGVGVDLGEVGDTAR